MQRFFVCRGYVKWKGTMYYKGDLLPEIFTHHDKARSIYNSRIGVCDVPKEEISAKETSSIKPKATIEDVPPIVKKPLQKGISGADKTSLNATTTGTQQ